MAIIDNHSGPSPLMALTPNMRALWVRFALSDAPAITDTAGVASVDNTDTGVFTITFVEAWPNGLFLMGAVAEGAAGTDGLVNLTSIDDAKQVATIEYTVGGETENGAVTDFLNLLFLAVER